MNFFHIFAASIKTKITNGTETLHAAVVQGDDGLHAGGGDLHRIGDEGELGAMCRLQPPEAGLRLRHHPQGRHHGSHMHKETGKIKKK